MFVADLFSLNILVFPESATRLALEKQPPYFQEKLVTICKTGWKVNIWNGFHICLHSSVGKESACSTGDPGSIPGSRRSPGAGNGNPLQYSWLKNSMGGGIWWATVHGVTKSRKRLNNFISFLFFCLKPSWTHLILICLCCILRLCHSFKSCALRLSLLLQRD